MLCIGVIFALLIWELGWKISNQTLKLITWGVNGALFIQMGCLIGLWKDRAHNRSTRAQFLFQFIVCLAILVVSNLAVYGNMEDPVLILRTKIILTALLVTLPTLTSISAFLEILIGKKHSQTLPPALLFLATLIFLAFLGAGMLMMPNATQAHGMAFVDAFFTSTSAVCVTGLSTVNFYSTFTPLGQLIVLILIQLGGFGIMTFAYFIALVLGQGFSLRDKVLIKDLLSEENLTSTTSFLRGLILLTFITELIGALGLWFSWQSMPLPTGTHQNLGWHALFHSISAFCNAGFSTLPEGLCYPPIAQNRWGQAIIMILIVMGGLGYAVFKGLYEHIKHRMTALLKHRRSHPVHLSTHIYLVLITTSALLVGGSLLLFFIEESKIGLAPVPWKTALWESLFNSVTTRTAGFNITPMAGYSAAAALVMCALMMIGGSPGGTAGGIRTTTFALIIGELKRIIRGRKEVEFHHRSIERDVIERSIAAAVLSGIWVGAFTLLSTYFEPNMNALDLFFENVSAFATVGLSRDVTPYLHEETKVLLCINMIAGRVGLFSFVIALAGRQRPRYFSYPSTKIPLN